MVSPAGPRLMVSVSSIFADTREAAAATIGDLDAAGVEVSLLIAPHIGTWHLAKDAETLAWLRAELAAGRTMLLNGFDQAVQGNRAEFATLPAHEARLRLSGATRQMGKLGLTSTLFAPPRWQLSAGTLSVLREFRFSTAASTTGLYQWRGDDWEFTSSRNLSVGEGYGAPGWWRRSVIKAARRGAERGNLVRLSASARNLREAKVRRDFIAAALAAREAGAASVSYRDLEESEPR